MRLIDADVLMEKANEHYRLALKRTEEAPFNDRYREQAIEREKFLGFISNAPTVTIDNTGYSQGFKDGKECTLVSIDAIEDITDCMVSIISEIDWEKLLKEANKRPRGEWIVDQTPSYTGLYMISIDSLVTVANFDGKIFRSKNDVPLAIDAWMPLPKAYKEKKNERN